MLEGKLAEARSKKDTLKARAASAKTSKQVQEMMGSLNTSNAVVAFDKMEEKVRGCRGGIEQTGEAGCWGIQALVSSTPAHNTPTCQHVVGLGIAAVAVSERMCKQWCTSLTPVLCLPPYPPHMHR